MGVILALGGSVSPHKATNAMGLALSSAVSPHKATNATASMIQAGVLAALSTVADEANPQISRGSARLDRFSTNSAT
jgi:hypothetical protein